MCIYQKPQPQLKVPVFTTREVHSFLDWLDSQQKDYICGEFLYDVKGYYKRLKQDEIFDYWIEHVHAH